MNESTDNDAAARPHGYLEWLNTEISVFEEYHNHKETMAWSATAAYLSVIVLAYAAAPRLAHHPVFQGLFSLLLLAVACVTSMFVNMQFQMRWKAADGITALRRVKGKLLSISPKQFQRLNLAVPDPDLDMTVEKVNWPTFVNDEIVLCTTVRQPFSEIMRYSFCPKKWREINARTRSELASYAVIIAVTVIAIACVLFNPGKAGNHGERFSRRGHFGGFYKPTSNWNYKFAVATGSESGVLKRRSQK